MSVTLEQALQGVDLEVGRTYHCQVKGRWIELRVLDTPPALGPAPLAESDVMLEAWAELPRPEPVARLRAKLGQLPPPDIPEIPPDDEHS